MTQISLVVAMNQDNIIGVNNQLPWHIPEDLAHFKQVTLGKPIVMGRKTYQSIGRALPGRKNIVISRNLSLKIDGVIVCQSLDQAIADNQDVPEICIIGGGEIFSQALEIADKLYITIVNFQIQNLNTTDQTVSFPKLDIRQWTLIETKDLVSSSGIACKFNMYVRVDYKL